MSASRRALAVAVVCVAALNSPISAAAQQSDQIIAERVLGPQWRQLSRRAGMIFTGTVLTAEAQTAAADQLAPAALPAFQVSFHVDQAIAGVKQGQTLTIHEWAGTWSMHRQMRSSQHILIFLYPPSRLGLTSPVGGSLGQVELDPSSKNVLKHDLRPAASTVHESGLSPRPRPPGDTRNVSVVQLERAIRQAKKQVKSEEE